MSRNYFKEKADLIPEELNGAALAYLGDAVLEIMVRQKVMESGYTNTGKLNELARMFVTAKAQSEATDKIADLLDEEELSFFKRGKNAKVNRPKSATASDYAKATGFEALFAFLYMKGRKDRLDYLFSQAYKDRFDEILNK